MPRSSRYALAGVVLLGASLLARWTGANAPADRYTIASSTVYDTKTKLTWQQTVPSGGYDMAGAQKYCSSLNLNGSGWRVPTLKELFTILDVSQSDPNPRVDPVAFPGTPIDIEYQCATPVPGTQAAQWTLSFYTGAAAIVSAQPYYLRCVR